METAICILLQKLQGQSHVMIDPSHGYTSQLKLTWMMIVLVLIYTSISASHCCCKMIQVLVVALYAFTADSALTGHEQAHASAIYKDKKGSLLLSVSSHSHVLYLA